MTGAMLVVGAKFTALGIAPITLPLTSYWTPPFTPTKKPSSMKVSSAIAVIAATDVEPVVVLKREMIDTFLAAAAFEK